MRLFHGSYLTVDRPEVKRGRAKVDFGQGFYLAKLCDQASSWAESVARRHRGGVAILNVFDFDDGLAHAIAGERYKAFGAYDMEWLDYVVDCRRGRELQLQYDVVERGIAEAQALDLFYSTDVYRQLTDPNTGLHLMSDGYILDDVRKGDA